MNLRHVSADFRVVARSYFRNPVALFFSLIFPIILIALFGLIFSASASTVVSLAVVNDDGNSPSSQAFLSALNNTSLVSVHVVNESAATFGQWLGQNDLPVGLVIPHGFAANLSAHQFTNLTLYTDPQDAQSSGQVEFAVTAVANEFNLHEVCRGTNCTAVVGVVGAQVGSAVYSYIDYLIPGLIGFSILTSPMFSMVDITSSYRKEGIFRQLSLTPLTRGEWLTSRVLWYVLLTFVTSGIMIGTGALLFHAHVLVGASLIPFLVVGPFLFVSLGMLAGSVARTPESAALIGNLITFPMMFLSGTFFPVANFPPGLQAFAHLLPLYYVIDGMNQVMLFSNASRAFFDLVVVLAIAVVFFVAAIRVFKWRDE
jgi:ABC-2 type transport system permease protein